MDVYVHYGTDVINKDHKYGKWKGGIFKPTGLWACEETSKDNWLTWSIDNRHSQSDFSKYVKFTLEDDAKILTVEKTEDIIPYLILSSRVSKAYKEKGISALNIIDGCTLNEIKLKKQFDGIKLIHGDKYNELHTTPGVFYSWDVDSIVIWNLDAVKVVSTSNDCKKRRIRICK